jgi:hypothetical protein
MPLPLAAIAGGGAVLGALGGIFGNKAKNKAAKQEAENQNAANAWQHRFNQSQYETEQMPYRKQGSKTRALRNQLASGLVNASSSGLAKMFPGYFNLQKSYDGKGAYDVENPYSVAGAPPQMKAATGGWQNYIGGALGGAAGGAQTALNFNSAFGGGGKKTPAPPKDEWTRT